MEQILNTLGNIKSLDFGPRVDGFNLLNVPDSLYKTAKQFWRKYNKPWLDKAIARGDIIILATEPKHDVLYKYNKKTRKEELTGFGREYYYLVNNGYKYDPNTMHTIQKWR